jgi:hypothetical protein
VGACGQFGIVVDGNYVCYRLKGSSWLKKKYGSFTKKFFQGLKRYFREVIN